MRGGSAPDAPLSGWCVVVTRARHQSFELVSRLGEKGARPLELALVEIVEPADGAAALAQALRRIDEFDWVVLSSANAVERCWRELAAVATSATRPKVAAVGAGTAAGLAERGVPVDLVPQRQLAEALVEVFPHPEGAARAVLLPQAAGARDVLGRGLCEKGWRVEAVEAYRTVPALPDLETLASLDEADVITFASSSAVTSFVELVGRDNAPPAVACIGPVTAATAVANGLVVDVVAAEHSVGGLVEALVAWAQGRVPKAGRR